MTEVVDTAMNVRNQGADGGRNEGGYLGCFLRSVGISGNMRGRCSLHTLNTSGVLARSWTSFTGTASKKVNCLH